MEEAMKISVKSNIKQFKKGLSKLEKKQLPFATSRALNFTGNEFLRHLKQRAKEDFKGGATANTLKAFKVTKSIKGIRHNIKYSTKKDLAVDIFLPEWAEKYLKYQIQGGTRKKERNHIFIPTRNTNLNKYGNIPGKQGKLAGKMKNTFTAEIKGIKGLWKRVGKGGREVKLLIAFEDTAHYRNPNFPFYDYGRFVLNRDFNKFLRIEFRRAMKTAK